MAKQIEYNSAGRWAFQHPCCALMRKRIGPLTLIFCENIAGLKHRSLEGETMLNRYIRLLMPLIFLSAVLVSGAVQKKGASSQDPFLGRWTLSHKSRFVAKEDRLVSMTRTYQRDGDKVKAAWQGKLANGKTSSGSYSAKCDGTPEKVNETTQITCQNVGRRRVDGEINDPADPDHRYFTRQVAADGQTMNIIWYRDAERKQVRDVLMFNRAK